MAPSTNSNLFNKTLTVLALVVTLASLTAAHSWIEEYQVVSSNGSYVGARGYSRGFMGRTDPGFNGFSDEWMLPDLSARNLDGTARTRINSSDYLCHPSQRTANYSSTYPKLQVQPGDYVAMKYLENGHVSLPWNITGKPAGGGTVFVFGTTQPADDEKIVNVMKWNSQGTAGDKRGFLMTAQNFDDGRCHQINCGDISTQRQMLTPNHVAGQLDSTVESWCETDLKIPASTAAGTLTVYWVWQWPTEPNMDCNAPPGKDEYYTTCADFDVVAGDSTNQKMSLAPFSAAPGANPQSVAVGEYKSRTAYVATPSVVLMENNKIVGSVSSVNSAFASSCSAQAPISSSNSLAMWPEVYVPNSCAVVTSFGTAAASSAAAAYSTMAASYSTQRSSVLSAAFAQSSMPVPSYVPWSIPPQTASGTPATSAASASPTAAPVPYENTTSVAAPAGSDSVEITTVTTVLVITSTLSAGQSIPVSSTSSPTVDITSTTTAPAAYTATASPSSAVTPAYTLSTILTVPATAASASTGMRRRDHPRRFR